MKITFEKQKGDVEKPSRGSKQWKLTLVFSYILFMLTVIKKKETFPQIRDKNQLTKLYYY